MCVTNYCTSTIVITPVGELAVNEELYKNVISTAADAKVFTKKVPAALAVSDVSKTLEVATKFV